VAHTSFDGVGCELRSPARPEANRHRQRERHFFAALLDHLAGRCRVRRVLDLGCNAATGHCVDRGRLWSSCSASTARSMHIEQARLGIRGQGVPSHRFQLRCGDLFSLDLTELGPFDVVLCLGLLYHVAQPVELMELIAGTGGS